MEGWGTGDWGRGGGGGIEFIGCLLDERNTRWMFVRGASWSYLLISGTEFALLGCGRECTYDD